MWAARLSVPLVFNALKEGARGLVGAGRWARLKRKIDWLPHSLALKRFKGGQVRFSFLILFYVCSFSYSHIVFHLLPLF